MSSVTLPFDEPAIATPSASTSTARPQRGQRAARTVTSVCILAALLAGGAGSGWCMAFTARSASKGAQWLNRYAATTCAVRAKIADTYSNAMWRPSLAMASCSAPIAAFPANQENAAQPGRGETSAGGCLPYSNWPVETLGTWSPSRASENSAVPSSSALVALPGEAWEIRRGDLWIEGRIQPKSLAQLRQMAVTVNDDRYRPKSQQTRFAPGRRTLTPALFPRERGESRRAGRMITAGSCTSPARTISLMIGSPITTSAASVLRPAAAARRRSRTWTPTIRPRAGCCIR